MSFILDAKLARLLKAAQEYRAASVDLAEYFRAMGGHSEDVNALATTETLARTVETANGGAVALDALANHQRDAAARVHGKARVCAARYLGVLEAQADCPCPRCLTLHAIDAAAADAICGAVLTPSPAPAPQNGAGS